jgi:glycosyltransferase
MIRILQRSYVKVSYLPEVIVNMRLGGESTKIENTISSTKEIIAIMKKHNINWRLAIIYRKLAKLTQLFKKS